MSTVSVRYITCVFIFGMTLYVSSAQAHTCKIETTSTTVTIPNMTIPRDAAVGTKIGETLKTGTITGFRCTNEAPVITSQQFGGKGLGTRSASKISERNVYLLGDSGIGYTVAVTNISSCSGTFYINGLNTGDTNVNNLLSCGSNGFLARQPMQVDIGLDFYKIGELKPGKVSAQNMASMILRTNQVWASPESTVKGTEFSLTSQGCSVTNTSISVPMGTVHSSHFKGVGSTTGDQDFSIPLSCDAGIKVGITVTGGSAGNFDADKGLINLDTSDTSTVASGVKLQILSKNAPVKLNSVIDLGTRVVQGLFSVPLTARYYQSASPITAGLANGTATFTMKYE